VEVLRFLPRNVTIFMKRSTERNIRILQALCSETKALVNLDLDILFPYTHIKCVNSEFKILGCGLQTDDRWAWASGQGSAASDTIENGSKA
jgi:hypothetical protein